MIVEYHRPTNLEEALQLLGRSDPVTRALAGGSVVNQPSPQAYAVVDLQGLGLNTMEVQGNRLALGATVTLQMLVESPQTPDALRRVAEREASYNLRQVATVAGTLASADGRSAFTTALLALDAKLTLLPGDEQVDLGDLLPLREERLLGRLITQITVPLNARLAFHAVARTLDDLPIVCAAAAAWPSGRTRLALGGYGKAPTLAFDGGEAEGAATAAESAYSAAEDAWATAEYRRTVAGVLARRAVEEVGQGE